MKDYISAGQLIKQTFTQTFQHYKTLLPYFWWMMFLALIMTVLFALDPALTNPFIVMLVALLYIAYIIYSIWVNVTLPRATAELVSKKKLSRDQVLRHVWWTALGAIILSLGTTIIVLTGYILLIIPGIYLTVLLSFAKYRLIIDDKDVMESLADSAKMVNKRWWAVFWRWLASGVVVTIVVYAIIFIVEGILVLINQNMEAWAAGVELIILSAFIPFLTMWSVIHYLSARDSAK